MLLRAVAACDRELVGVLEGIECVETPEEVHKIRLAIGSIFSELDQHLVSPTLRQHPELMAEAVAMKLR